MIVTASGRIETQEKNLEEMDQLLIERIALSDLCMAWIYFMKVYDMFLIPELYNVFNWYTCLIAFYISSGQRKNGVHG